MNIRVFKTSTGDTGFTAFVDEMTTVALVEDTKMKNCLGKAMVLTTTVGDWREICAAVEIALKEFEDV